MLPKKKKKYTLKHQNTAQAASGFYSSAFSQLVITTTAIHGKPKDKTYTCSTQQYLCIFCI